VAPNAVYTVSFKVVVVTVPTVNPILNQANVSYVYSPAPGTTVTIVNPTSITTGQINYVDMNAMSKSSNAGYAKVGDTVTYTVNVPNNGNVDANNVVLKDTIPTGSTFVNNSVSINGVNTPGANPQSGINIGTVNAGSSSVVKYQVVVVSIPASGKLLNQVTSSYTFTVDPSNPDGRGGGATSNINQVSVTNASLVGPPGTPGANNTGSKVGTPTNIDIGDVVSYTITMKNTGNVPAIKVIVKDTLPTCTTLVSGSVTVNGVANSSSPFNGSGLFVGTIPSGSTAIVAYKLKVTCLPTPAPATLKNQADITYSFITDPSLPETTVTGPTNLSSIPVTTAGYNINGENGVVKTADKSFAAVGDVITYSFNITNLGNTSTNNTVFQDTIPQGTAFVPGSVIINGTSNGTANPSGGINLGTVAPQQLVTLSFKVLVLTTPTPNPVLNQALMSYTYTVDPSVPNGRGKTDGSNVTSSQINTAIIGKPVNPGDPNGSGVLKSANPKIADIGDTITYTMVVENSGNVPAENVVVSDTIPVGSTFVIGSVTVDGVIQPSADPQVGVALGNIAPNVTRTITFKALVVSLPPSKVLTDTPIVNFSYHVDPNGPAVPATGGGTTVTVPVNTATISPNDGGLTKSATPSYVTIGDTITYSVVLRNTGSINATNVQVFDTLQNGVVFVNGSVKINGSIIPAANPTVGILVSTVAPNQTVTITFNAKVYTVPNPNPVLNQANVSYSYSPEPGRVVTTTNPSPTTTTPVRYVDISQMSKSSTPSYVAKGDIITYTVLIPNNGNVAANNLIIQDTLPQEVSFVLNSVTVNGVAKPGQNIETGILVGTVNAGQTTSVTFKALVLSIPNPGAIKNQINSSYTFTVDPSVPNGRGGTGTSNINTTTISQGELVGPPGTPGANNGGSKVSDQTVVDIGDVVTYTISLFNGGNQPVFNVLVKDTIPTCSSFIMNSVTINGASSSESPVTGIHVGTIPVGATTDIQYQVKVTCLPTPEPAMLKNQADISYSYIKDPSLPAITTTSVTNLNTLPVVTASFGNINGKQGTVKTVDNEYATIGDVVTYTITLTNYGNTSANNVNFVDTIPSGTSFVQDSVTVNGVAKPGANPAGGISLGSVAPNQTVAISFKVLVLTIPSPNPIQNQAVTSYNYVVDPTKPPRGGIDASSIVKTQINYAVIGTPNGPGKPGGSGVLKSASPMVADIGDTVTYSLVLTNNGNVPAENVVIKDTIPQGTTFVTDSVEVNGAPQLGVNPSVGVAVGNIAPKATTTVTFKVMVVSVPPSKAVVNTPSVSYKYTVDPAIPGGAGSTDGGNTVTIPVNTAIIDVKGGGLVKSVDKNFTGLGGIVTYTVALKNTGTVNANNTVLYDTIPQGSSFVTGSATVDGVPQNSDPLTGINVGVVAPGQVRTVTFKVSVVTVPEPNPMPNNADVSYCYNV
ncbi:MAG: beta strand repeat-containing protein, partial [Clostridium sp.]